MKQFIGIGQSTTFVDNRFFSFLLIWEPAAGDPITVTTIISTF